MELGTVETERLITEYFDAFNARDVDRRLAILAENVRHDYNEGPTEYGREAFAAFIAYMDARYEETIEELCIMSNGRRGAAEFMVRGRYLATDGGLPQATGQSYRIPAAAFFEVVDGKIARVTSYYNLKGWIAAIS